MECRNMLKKENTITNQKETVNECSLEEAKKEIYELIQQGVSNQEITKKEFMINGTIKRFNPSQIRKIKEEFEPSNKQNNKDGDKALVFKYLASGMSPAKILIKTEFPFEFIKQARQEYLEFTENQDVPNHIIENLLFQASRVFKCKTVDDLPNAIYEAVESHLELQKHVYPCKYCGEDIPIRNKSLQDAIDHLVEAGWRHNACAD